MKTYLALGDSYTIGESVPPNQRWCHQLVELLNQNNIGMSQPSILAKTGWTTAQLLEAIAQARLNQKFDMVSLLIGVNNQYRGLSLAQYKREFTELLKLSIDLTNRQNNRVFVLSIPDWGVSPFASDRDTVKITDQIMAFNQAAQKICLVNKVAFVDILPMSRLGLNNPSMIADDDLHFSDKMYGLWAKEAYQVVQKMF